jgi:hypothetical protein
MLRHDWNDRFSDLAQEKGWSNEKEPQHRNYLQDWTKTSKQGLNYIRRSTREEAINAALELQRRDWISELTVLRIKKRGVGEREQFKRQKLTPEIARLIQIVEATQVGAIVVGNEGVEIGVAFGMIAKAAMGTKLRHAVKMLAEAAVEALDHAVGLRPEGAR